MNIDHTRIRQALKDRLSQWWPADPEMTELELQSYINRHVDDLMNVIEPVLKPKWPSKFKDPEGYRKAMAAHMRENYEQRKAVKAEQKALGL